MVRKVAMIATCRVGLLVVAKIHFIKALIEAIEPTDKIQTFTDDQTRGFTLIVTPKGAKTFYLTRKYNDRVERNKLGRFPETSIVIARERAAKLHLQYDGGINAAEAKRKERAELTLDEFFEVYYREHSLLHNRRPDVVKDHYRWYVAPLFGRTRLSKILRTDVAQHHRDIGRSGRERTANKMASQLRAIFNKAIAWEYFDGPNPAQHIDRFREYSRDRFLSKSELDRFHQGLRKEDVLYRDFFMLLLYTGARKSEMLNMCWRDVQLEDEVWRIPDTKNGEPRRVVLAGPSIAILQRRIEQRHVNDRWVFPSAIKPSQHVVEVKRAWERVLNRAGIENLRIHDLRRTHASWMLEGGADMVIIGKALGHKDIASTLVYARLNLDPVRRHVEKTARRLSPSPELVKLDSRSR